jgi:ankyrin repeat protein
MAASKKKAKAKSPVSPGTKATAKAKKNAAKLKKERDALLKQLSGLLKKRGTAADFDKATGLIEQLPIEDLNSFVAYGKTLLGKAIDAEWVNIVRFLLDKGVSLKKPDGTSSTTYLYDAVSANSPEILLMLVEKKAIDINAGQPAPLQLAATLKTGEPLMKILLDNGADIDKKSGYKNRTALLAASSNKNVKFLLSRGADVRILDNEDRNALFYCVDNTNKTEAVACFKTFLTAGIDINALDRSGKSPLMYMFSQFNSNLSLLYLMVDNGATIDIKDGDGNTVLHNFHCLARDIPDKEKALKYLISKGLNVNIRNNAGRSPLMHKIVTAANSATVFLREPIDSVRILLILGAEQLKGPGAKADVRPSSSPLIEAIIARFLATAELLIQKGNGEDLNWVTGVGSGKGALHRLAECSKSKTPALITLFVGRPGVNINVRTGVGAQVPPLYLSLEPKFINNTKALIAGGANVNMIFGGTTVTYACANKGYLETLEYLLGLPQVDKEQRYGALGTLYNIAKTTERFAAPVKAMIIKMLGPKLPMWKGWSRANASRFDGIFADDAKEAADVTCCPICLKTVVRSDGCVYIQGHNCTQMEGFYHEELYDRYKNEQGNITWCTICGRIAHGHRHYKISMAQDPVKPELLATGNPFAADCSAPGGGGGGGVKEKLARYRRMREYALELQDEIGKKTEKEALEEMVEEMWNAPIARKVALAKMLEKKAWNIPSDAFPMPVDEKEEEVDMTKLPDLEKPAADSDLKPLVVKGIDAIMGGDEEDVIQFRHRQKNGEVFEHVGDCISAESLELFISGQNAKFKTDESFGLCWSYPGKCNARLYPSDIKAYIDEEMYKEYKAKFNWRFRAQRGGKRAWATRKIKKGLKSVFVPATDAQCLMKWRK